MNEQAQSSQPMTQGDLMAYRLGQLEQRVSDIDKSGTHGVAVLQLRVDQLIKDFAEHEAHHREAAQQQISSRRWLIGTSIALLTVLIGMGSLLLATFIQVKGALP